MKKALVPLANGFEDIEAVSIIDVLRRGRVDVVTASLSGTPIVKSAHGIEMLAVETKTLDLPDDNKSAVYTRMISERNNIAASYTAEGEAEAKRIRNEADKQVEITLSKAKSEAETVKAAGDAEYMRILANVYDTED